MTSRRGCQDQSVKWLGPGAKKTGKSLSKRFEHARVKKVAPKRSKEVRGGELTQKDLMHHDLEELCEVVSRELKKDLEAKPKDLMHTNSEEFC